MTQEAHLKIVHNTASSKNTKQYAVGCKYIHTKVNGRPLTISRTAGVHRELHDQFITSHNGKSPCSTKAFVRTVCKIDHHDIVSSLIFADKFPDNHPREWTKHVLITIEEAMKAYMAEVIVKSHC